MRPQYIQKHPKISNQELTRVPSEERRKVPEQLRVKHSQDLEKEKKDIRALPGRIRVLELWFSSTSHSAGRKPQRGPLSTRSVSIHTLGPGVCENVSDL